MDVLDLPAPVLPSTEVSGAKKPETASLPNIVQEQQKARTHEDRVKLAETVFGTSEPSAQTLGTYADVLADEYASFQQELTDINSAHPNATPQEVTQLLQNAGLQEWQQKMFTVMSRETARYRMDWDKATDEQKRSAYRAVFEKMLTNKDPQVVKEWVLTGMLATQRRIMALQLATEVQIRVEREADKLERVKPRTALGPMSSGNTVSVSSLQKPESAKKRSAIGKMIMFPINVAAAPFRGAGEMYRALRHPFKTRREYDSALGLAYERHQYRDFAQSHLFSEANVEIPKNAQFDPDREIQGHTLDQFQKRLVSRFAPDFENGRGFKDPSGKIGSELLRLTQAQADTSWSLFRTQFRSSEEFNIIQDGHFTDPGFYAMETGIIGTVDAHFHDRDVLNTKLSELMDLALDRQQPEVEVKGRARLSESVTQQIAELDKRLNPAQDTETAQKQAETKKKIDAAEAVVKDIDEYDGIDAKVQELEDQENKQEAEIDDVIQKRDVDLPKAQTAVETAENTLKAARKTLSTIESDINTNRQELALVGNIKEFLLQREGLANQISELDKKINTLQGKTKLNPGEEKVLEDAIAQKKEFEKAQSNHEQAITNFKDKYGIDPLKTDTTTLLGELITINNAINVSLNSNESSKETQEKNIEKAQKTVEEKKKEQQDLQTFLDSHQTQLQAIEDIKEKINKLRTRKQNFGLKHGFLVKNQQGGVDPGQVVAADLKKTKQAEIDKLQKELGGASIGDIRQKEALEIFKTKYLDPKAFDAIQSRAMEPHFANRLPGVQTDSTDDLHIGMEFRPHIPPAYLEVMRIFAGKEALADSTEGRNLYTETSKLVSPQLFMDVYLSNAHRRQALADLLGRTTLPARMSFYDIDLNSSEVRTLMLNAVTPELISEIFNEMQERAVKGTLGRMVEAQTETHGKLKNERIKPEDLKKENETLETGHAGNVELQKTAYATSRTASEGALYNAFREFDQNELNLFWQFRPQVETQLNIVPPTTPFEINDLFDQQANAATPLRNQINTFLITAGLPAGKVNGLSPEHMSALLNAQKDGYRLFSPVIAELQTAVTELQNQNNITIPPETAYTVVTVVDSWRRSKQIDIATLDKDKLGVQGGALTPEGQALSNDLATKGINITDREELLAVVKRMSPIESSAHRSDRVTQFTREFMDLGEATAERIHDAAMLSSITSLANKEMVQILENAFAQMKTKTGEHTLAELLTYIPEDTFAEVDALMVSIHNQFIAIYTNLTGNAIQDINEIPIDDLPTITGAVFGKFRGKGTLFHAEGETMGNLVHAEIKESLSKRMPEILDKVFWGVEGDDLVVALQEYYMQEQDSLKKAQLMAYRIQELRKSSPKKFN